MSGQKIIKGLEEAIASVRSDPVAVDAGLMAGAEGLLVKYDIDMRHEKADEIRADFYAALQAAEERGAERMRERAAKVADEYKAKMTAAQERLGALGRPTSIAECKEDAADWLATAIRALPLSETET